MVGSDDGGGEDGGGCWYLVMMEVVRMEVGVGI